MRRDLFILIVVIVLIAAVWFYVSEDPTEPNLAIFSWDQETVMESGEETSDFLHQHNIKRLFQSFSSDLSSADIQLFREQIGSEIAVYQLIGTPEWAQVGGSKSLIEAAERVTLINQQLARDQQLKGIVVDVEPYLLDDFDWGDDAMKMSFMANMRQLYTYLTAHDLEMITVVPYFYDTRGYQDVLTFLITEATTELAIMNYYREDEIEHMMYEASVAASVKIPITTIYEFKPPGEYGLTERNTYYEEGLDEALMNLDAIIDTYADQDIYGAIHDLTALKEVVGDE